MISVNYYMDDQYANLLIHECVSKEIQYSDEYDVDTQMHYILVHCATLDELEYIDEFTDRI